MSDRIIFAVIDDEHSHDDVKAVINLALSERFDGAYVDSVQTSKEFTEQLLAGWKNMRDLA